MSDDAGAIGITPGTHPDLTRATARAEADRLVVEGDLRGAVDVLQRSYRADPRPRTAIELVDLRAKAAHHHVAADPGATWPHHHPDPFPDTATATLPETAASELSGERLGGGVAHHGAVVVRGLLSTEQATTLVELIHRIAARRDASRDASSAPDDLYRPYRGTGFRGQEHRRETGVLRGLIARQGGTWLGDSPVGTARVLDALEDSGVVGAVRDHLGERPCFSLQKSTLRRSPPENRHAGWHQDGSFLGAETRTMNVWVALSDCGGDLPSPGLEVVPARVDRLLPTDSDLGPVAISHQTVMGAAGVIGTTRPEFAAGDALVFDERFIHRSHFAPGMTADRYALECWMFAVDHFPATYVPLLM